MGSGASMEKDALKPLLLSKELVDGSALLVSNELLRHAFTHYLKGGAWLDRLSQLVPEVQSGFSENSHDDNDCMLCLKEYNVDQERLNTFAGSSKNDKSFSISTSSSSTPTKPQPAATHRYGDLYSGETKSFNHEEVLVILLSVLYPIYLSSREYERFVKYGVEHDSGSQDELSCRSVISGGNRHATRMVQTNQSNRAQELLLSCAARYDETVLSEYLKTPSWLQQVCTIFHQHTLALCITDTARTGLPILFANKAFCNAFGYAESELVGQNLSFLNGPSTEPPQLKLMQNSIHSTDTVKFSITLQSKSKKSLFDLVAQKAVGTYSISAHFVMTKTPQLEALNMVDDVLILLSYLVKAPALPTVNTRPSWLPAPIAILARTATGAFSQLSQSPSSIRSHVSHRGRAATGLGTTGKSGSIGSIVSGGALGVGRNNSNGSSSQSFRSFRPGTTRLHSKGEPSTPTSYRSAAGARGKDISSDASGASGATVSALSAGKHLPADEDAVVEFSVGTVLTVETRGCTVAFSVGNLSFRDKAIYSPHHRGTTYCAMGSGVSVHKDTLRHILLSQELLDGSTKLGTDPLFRASFTNYLKSGIWLDRLSRLVPESQIAISDIARGGSKLTACLNEYGVSHDKLISLKSSSSEKSTHTKPSLHSSSKSTAFEGHGDLYSGETTSFQQEGLLILLFTMVYPFYLSSYEFERYVKYGIEHGKGAEDDHSSRSSVTGNQQGAGVVQDNSSKRAQELLLSCAAYYDESFLQQYLEEPSWLQRVCSIFHDHTLALCITDTSKGGLPILFANKEFCQMFGYSESELIGHDFTSLSGKCTEMPQLTLMHSNIHSTAIVKFAITLQHKSKKPLLDLVAQKAVGTFSIRAHFVMTKSAPLDALNMVDDVLILLSYLVKAPALPARPSWLPTPIVILARSASNALYAASPSSVRSRSSSSSLGGNRSRTHSSVHGQGPHAKDGKGTPTSFRSHGGGVVLSSGSGSAPSSFRSIRTGGIRCRSRGGGENGTPTSLRSGASSRSAATATRDIDAVSAGLHVPMDADDTVEVSVGESAHTNIEPHHK